jgi:nucleoid DNA-binding protein
MNSEIRTEMINRISKESGVTKKAAKQSIDIVFDVFKKTLENQKSFVIPTLGIFTGYLRPEKMVKDPRNGTMILGKPKWFIKTKAYIKK